MEEQVEAMQRMQDYIQVHLNKSITQADLARASPYSLWYSYRLSVRHVGMTPSDYTRRFRLSWSAMQLRDGRARITNTAFEMGLGSVGGYQRTFFKEFGCNPGKYAVNPVPISLFTPCGVKYRHIRREKNMKQIKNMFIQVVERPERKALIKRGIRTKEYFSYCQEAGCDVWGLLTSIRSLCGEPVCMWLPRRSIEPGTSPYVQGVEVPADYEDEVPGRFSVMTLPACRYLMFQGEPSAKEDYCQAVEQVQKGIKKYDPLVIGYQQDKNNPRIQLEPVGTRRYIELLSVKPV